jgi:1-acyl-sn-glycerol-3-phosphate acyltransferase
VRNLVRTVLRALVRLLFTYDCKGQDKIPAGGPAVIASNHPSYLDPLLLSLDVERPIRFMAWDALFRVPVLGRLLETFGAFPVDVRKGRGREAYEKAKTFLDAGELVGIFPEGKRSPTGWMEPRLREGAARLVWETGVPLVPATIAGAYRAWPYFQTLPRPSRIKVRFHDPIDPGPHRGLPEEQAIPALLGELHRRVDRSLLPGVKADLKKNVLFGMPAPWPRPYEAVPALALAALVIWTTGSLLSALPAYGYLAYLLADRLVIPQDHLVKWIRNASPVVFLLAYGPIALVTLGLPPVTAGEALAAIVLGSVFPYLYERGRVALGFIRGVVLTAGLELAALHLAPTGVGPHVALPVYAAAYAWEGRTFFWRYAVPVLSAYALAGSTFIGGGLDLVPHAAAGLLGWLLARLFPYRPPSRAAGLSAVEGLGLPS